MSFVRFSLSDPGYDFPNAAFECSADQIELFLGLSGRIVGATLKSELVIFEVKGELVIFEVVEGE